MSDSLEEPFTKAAAELRQPAGPDDRFSSLEKIRANHDAFLTACHATWKKWHEEAVRQILVFEGFTDRERKTRALGAPALDWAEYNQALWRKVNDAIIWSLVGQQRHVIKRLCLYHARPMLSQSNPESVLRVLNKVNANPRSLAIWNDATSCVDISDVTYIEDGMKPNPVFWELKEGVVNDEIMTLVTSGTEGAADKIQALHERRGEKGLAQLERFLRQTMTARSALTLLREEKGIDPVTGAHTRIISVESALEVWDKTLGEVANEALRKSGPATGAVDQCLWIYADATPELSRHEAMARFQHWLVKNVPASAATFQTNRQAGDKDQIVPLNVGFYQPLARPMFLKNVEPAVIGAMVYRELMFRVLLYIDWDAFGKIVTEEGGKFAWSSEKEARRARSQKPNRRPAIVRGRVAEIHVGEVRLEITDLMLVEMLFDGITPRSMIRQSVEFAKHPENFVHR